MTNFIFDQRVVMRTPVLPLNTAISQSSILHHLNQPFFREALFLASDSLYFKSLKLLEGKLKNQVEADRVMVSLATYLNRMSYRSTPFGLFAGCTVVRWGEEKQIIFDSNRSKRHTRLDMSFLCALSTYLASLPQLSDHIRYYANSTLYHIGDEIRYVEKVNRDGSKLHQISSIASSSAIMEVLECLKKGPTIVELVDFLAITDIDKTAARQFIIDLIESQVIVSEFEPQLTGMEFMIKIANIIERIASTSGSESALQIDTILKKTVALISKLDQETPNSHESYESIQRLLKSLGMPLDKARMFQADLGSSAFEGTIHRHYQSDIHDAAFALRKLSARQSLRLLDEFKIQFYSRYESQELPLTVVLDTEVGIGYSDIGKDGNNPLIEDLQILDGLPDQKQGVKNETDRFLFEKIKMAEISNQKIIDLSKDELESLPDTKKPLPPSMAALFRITEDQQVFVESITGSSAKNLLARFAYGDPEIESMIQSITKQEEQHNPDVLFAEIVHLPEDRLGNILLRPILHAYEIPYLASAAVTDEFEISLRDLYVSVKDNRVTLRSKRLNKVIIPRLSTAHNYTVHSLPVYRFLCDLQNQGCQTNLFVDWTPQRMECRHLPRLVYKNVILSPETWELSHLDIKELVTGGLEAFDQFREKWGLPDCFVLTEGDRELVVDIKYPLTIRSMLKTIKGSKTILIKENLSGQVSIVKDTQHRPYANQFLAILTKNEPTYSQIGQSMTTDGSVMREFPPGTEWIYFKIYCGVKSADKILIETIKPLTEELLKEKIIDHWFFIRYADPDYHLRIRIHVLNHSATRLGQIIDRFNQRLVPYKENHHYWKLQVDTYQREIERYGASCISQSERLFHYDTVNTLQLIQTVFMNYENDYRWLWGVVMIENLMKIFRLGEDQKFMIISELNNSFCAEFKVDKKLKHQLDKKYRKHKDKIKSMCNMTIDSSNLVNILVGNAGLIQVADKILKMHEENQLNISPFDLLKSYVHMSLNRLLPAKQRTYELMIYNFLFREYKSKRAILKK